MTENGLVITGLLLASFSIQVVLSFFVVYFDVENPCHAFHVLAIKIISSDDQWNFLSNVLFLT